jgi:hypothetical protein
MRSARTKLLATALSVAFAATTLAPTVAHADEPDKKTTEEARGRFLRGVELYRDGDYRGALIEFNRAYQTAPNFRVLFNIGQTCVELQDYACGLKAFEKYLADAKSDGPADRRTTAENEVKRLQRLVGHIRLVVDQPGAEVLVDNVSIGKTPLPDPILVSAGRRTVQVILAPNPTAMRAVDVAGGDRVEVKIDLGEAPKRDPRPVTTPVIEPPPRRDATPAPARTNTAAWVGVGVTGALTAGTVVFGLVTLSAKKDLDRLSGQPGLQGPEMDDARSKVKRDALVTDILGAAAIVGAGVTTYLFLSGGGSSAPVRVGISPFGASLDARF